MLIIGHRGAAQLAPENTLLAIDRALECGVDMVEIDVHLCRTGELVVIHDETVDRTTNGTGFVAQLSLQEIKNFDAGDGQKIPTLQEVIEHIDKRVPLNIELKGYQTAAPVAQAIQEYMTQGWSSDDFFVSSFNHFQVQAFRALCPRVTTGAILYGLPISRAESAQQVDANVVCMSKHFIDQAFIDDAHDRGLQVFVYTVNEPIIRDRMASLGVDGLFTDTPNRLL